MRGFLEKVSRTDERTNGRTNGRTDGGELIGPISASGRGPKTLKTVNFGPKTALNGPNFAISEFSQHIEYDFLKEDHKNNFHKEGFIGRYRQTSTPSDGPLPNIQS